MSAVDELDVFAAYLFGRVGRTDIRPGVHMHFAASTSDFDAYYQRQGLGVGQVEKPTRVQGKVVEAFLAELAARRPRAWLETSFVLLDLSLTEAAALNVWCEKGARRSLGRKKWAATVVGGTALVAIASGTAVTEVLIEIASVIPRTERRVMIQLGPRTATLLSASRSTR